MRFRFATWNINSVRLRADLVSRFADEFQPDILCLQEIKCKDELFPFEQMSALGFPHILICGQAGYHGVAILSRLPLTQLPREKFCHTDDARHIGARIAIPGSAKTVAIHNLYIPAGGDVPDEQLNPKFAQKLRYLKTLREWSADGREEFAILAGDFNVAPLETDVWSHKQLLNVVSHTPIEVEHLTAVQEAGRWVDAARHWIDPKQRLYSWWSYRARNWEASDRGRRLDHIWVSPSMKDGIRGVIVHKPARNWPRPSDHVPVIADLEIPLS